MTKKGPVRIWPWLLVFLLGVALVGSMSLNAGLIFGKATRGMNAMSSAAVDEYPQFTEEWSYGEGEIKAVRISVSGVIMRQVQSGPFGMIEERVEDILRQIRVAGQDEEVKALILEVDSPGGAVTPTDEIYDALMDFKKADASRKIIVYVQDMAASGGYYVAMAGDWIVAQPTAIIGSIGVIMQSINFKDLAEQIGVKDVTIKSGTNKDLLNPFREVSPEQIALLQETVDNMYDRFFGIVKEGRSFGDEELKALADGRVFTAEQALEHKMIDELGYWAELMVKLEELTGEPTKVVRYRSNDDFFSRLTKVIGPGKPFVWQDLGRPSLMYYWRP